MKPSRKKQIIGLVRLAGMLAALYGWWGMLYPQFTLLEGTYRIVEEEGSENVIDRAAICRDIMNADAGHIRIKCRFLENRNAPERAGGETHESGKQ